MEPLSIFALIILIILALTAIIVWIALAVMPGRIAMERHHKQADAVRICGYWGAITLGLLMPVAFIWAYWDFGSDDDQQKGEVAQ